MASLPHDRESFLSTQLKSATVEDDAECGICQDVYKDPTELPCGHIFCRGCISLWLAGKKTCPLDRIPLFEAEDEVDDEIEVPSVAEKIETGNERIRAMEADLAAIQEPFRVMRRMFEKSYHDLFMSARKEAKTQAEVDEVCEGRQIYREVLQKFRSHEQTLWSAAASDFLAGAAEYLGREVDTIDPGRFPDVLLVVHAKGAQYKAASFDFIFMVKNVIQWSGVSKRGLLRVLGMEHLLQDLGLDEDDQREDDQHEDDQHEDGQYEHHQHEDDLDHRDDSA